MPTIPTFESILLQINQSFGGIRLSTNKKRKFSTRRIQKEGVQKIYKAILKIYAVN